MRLATLLAVFLLGSGSEDAGPRQGAPAAAEGQVLRGPEPVLLVDTTAVSPPLRVRHGSVEPDKVREVVSSHRAALLGCYQRAVAETPSLSGTCNVRIVVTGDGTVGSASMHPSNLHSLSLDRCVLQLVRSWRFPAPADGRAAAIEYPLAFRREGSDGAGRD